MKLETQNTYKEQFEEFQNTTAAKRLEMKFRVKPYFEKYQNLQRIALIASYLFNVLSALTAATLVYFFIEELTGSDIISGVVTALFLGLLEIAKRQTAGGVFKDRLQFRKLHKGLTAVAVMLVCLSVTFSYFGAQRMVNEFTATPTLLSIDTAAAPIVATLAEIDHQIKDARATKWKGTTTSRSQKAIDQLTAAKVPLIEELTRIRVNTDNSNMAIKEQHSDRVQLSAQSFAGVTLLLELLFLLCAFYLEYYDYRSFIEFSKANLKASQTPEVDSNIKTGDSEENAANDVINCYNNDLENESKAIAGTGDFSVNYGHDETTIQQAIKAAKQRLSAASGRLRDGIGKATTNKKNIDKWTNEVNRLDALLQTESI